MFPVDMHLYIFICHISILPKLNCRRLGRRIPINCHLFYIVRICKSKTRQVNRLTRRQIGLSSIDKWRWGCRPTGSFLIVHGSRFTGRQVDKSVLITCINGCVGICQSEVEGKMHDGKKESMW